MEKPELRSLVFSALRNQPATHFDGVKTRIRNLAVDYQPGDDLTVHEILWELLTQGVLAPGMSPTHLDLPSIHVTEFGQKVLGTGDLQPHDPDGYLAGLQNQLDRPLDKIIFAYTAESLKTFLGGHYFASIVLLGVAAERGLDLLSGACHAAMADPMRRKSYEQKMAQAGRNIQRRVGTLRGEILNLSLPSELIVELDVHLSGLFTLIRLSRDEWGLPEEMPITRDVAHGNLLVFPHHCQWIYRLISHLRPQKAREGNHRTE